MVIDQRLFWRKVLKSDEIKVHLFDHFDMFGGVKLKLRDLRALYELLSMAVAASCCGAVFLPVLLIQCTKWIK